VDYAKTKKGVAKGSIALAGASVEKLAERTPLAGDAPYLAQGVHPRQPVPANAFRVRLFTLSKEKLGQKRGGEREREEG
jgi:ABC-type cobalamin transport system ATPase subunit